MALRQGQVLESKYVIDRLLAQGGMGEVYLGTNVRLGSPVAVKVLQPCYANDAICVERFEREAKIAARIRSEHVTDVYDLGELPSGERFLVMEYLDGETLADRMAREGRIAYPVLARIAVQVLDALAAAHAAGVVHRDLKPENIFLARGSRDVFVKLVDFGISKLDDPRETKRVTAVGAILGTPMYMSAEQARGQTVDHRTDLFALGVVMYEAATGLPPYDAKNTHELLFRIADGTRVPIRQRLPNVDRALETMIERAMAHDRDDRYQTAEEMREAVLAWESVLSWGSGLRLSLDALDTAVSAMPSFADRVSTLPGVDPMVTREALPTPEPAFACEPVSSASLSTSPSVISSPSIMLTTRKAPRRIRRRARVAAYAAVVAAAMAGVAFARPSVASGDLTTRVLAKTEVSFGRTVMLEDDLPKPPPSSASFVVPAAVPSLALPEVSEAPLAMP